MSPLPPQKHSPAPSVEHVENHPPPENVASVVTFTPFYQDIPALSIWWLSPFHPRSLSPRFTRPLPFRTRLEWSGGAHRRSGTRVRCVWGVASGSAARHPDSGSSGMVEISEESRNELQCPGAFYPGHPPCAIADSTHPTQLENRKPALPPRSCPATSSPTGYSICPPLACYIPLWPRRKLDQPPQSPLQIPQSHLGLCR